MSAAGSVAKYLLKNKGTVLNGGIGVWSGMATYQDKREQGAGKLSAATSAGLDMALPMMMSFKKYMGLELAMNAPGLAYDAYKAANDYRRQLGRENSGQAFVNAKFNDNAQIFTMRQAAMAMAERSKYNTQQMMLGREAKYMRK